ncbi:hypothetical protein [Streptomyces sp. ST2-7A]|uniref:hypothetical protein n=1 Tax=Streptomyces sp. ST2-7A TaxID=2907214 RepID=UPI001F188A41|nr:hypothetical protein [Streptomyces sp. ST2-7A]MCE7083116.1 hypothetical protein [Streptomyces sp. ST2-7A]
MRIRPTETVLTVAVLLVLTVGCSADDGPDDPPVNEGGTSAPSPPGTDARSGPGAGELVAELRAELGEEGFGESRDNTEACSNEAAGGDRHEKDCDRLVVTDQVSVYEFPTGEVAAEWVNRYGDFHGEEWRTVGRFALVWNTPEQAAVPAERRDEITELVEGRAGEG